MSPLCATRASERTRDRRVPATPSSLFLNIIAAFPPPTLPPRVPAVARDSPGFFFFFLLFFVPPLSSKLIALDGSALRPRRATISYFYTSRLRPPSCGDKFHARIKRARRSCTGRRARSRSSTAGDLDRVVVKVVVAGEFAAKIAPDFREKSGTRLRDGDRRERGWKCQRARTTKHRDLELTPSSARPPACALAPLASAPVSRGFLRFSRGRARLVAISRGACTTTRRSASSVLRPARPNDARLQLTKRLIRARCRNRLLLN